MQDIKKVSVVMSTYNGDSKGGYIWEQLDSVLTQTYPLHEIIIQDDGSTDETWSKLCIYSLKSSIIKLFRNVANLGVGNAWISAWNRANGEYIVVCDDDDLWLPDKVKILISAIGNKILAIGQSMVIKGDDYDNFILGYKWSIRNPHTATIEKLMFNNCVGGGLEMMFHVRAMNYINRIESSNSIVPDYLLAIIGYYLNSVAVTDEITQYCRINPRSTSGREFKTVEVNKIQKHIPGYKILHTNICLIKGNKSRKITEAFTKKIEVIQVLMQEKTRNELLSLLSLMRQQTFLSYWKASTICYRLRNNIFSNTNGFKGRAHAFFYVHKWWFDHRFDC